jgi:hypothetical protein
MSLKGACRETAGALMVAPVGGEEWNGSRPAAPDRRMDRGEPLGRAGTRQRSPAARIQRSWRGGGCVPRQPELEWVQEGTMDGTPQPSVAHFVEALGHHMLEKAADARVGRQGHGPPALGLAVLGAEAHLALLAREEAVVGQRDAVDIPA